VSEGIAPVVTTGLSTITDSTQVVLHPLSVRDDGDTWVIGRLETGDFVAVPPVAHRAITLLADGGTVGDVARALRQETGTDFAVADFVASLDDVGFLAAIDGRARDGPRPPRPSLPWLRPQHVRWLLHPAAPWLALAIIIAATSAVLSQPGLMPGYHDLVWSMHSGLVLAVNAALAWTLVWLHELGHLATARATGAPARMSLSTRLQFLVAQTDVSGVWVAPRRARLTVYLAGMTVNVMVASACILTIGLAHPAGLARQLLAVAALEALLMLPLELLIFVRTDVYFLVQDLAGCANLYADSSARLRYLAQCAWRAARRTGDPPQDPLLALPPRERRIVHTYSWLLLFGTACCAAAAVWITIPAIVSVLANAIGELGHRSPASRADGIAAVIIAGGPELVWLRTWWRRHGDRVTAFAGDHKRRSAERR
jgi:putative peptide zinc metalloprotease protein